MLTDWLVCRWSRAQWLHRRDCTAGIGVGIILFEAHFVPQLEAEVNTSIESCLVKSFHFVFSHFDYISTRCF